VAVVGFVHRLFLGSEFLKTVLPNFIVTWLSPMLTVIYWMSWMITGVWLGYKVARAVVYFGDLGAMFVDRCWQRATRLTVNILREALAKLDNDRPLGCADSEPEPEPAQQIPKEAG
jgi:hypothetical protein